MGLFSISPDWDETSDQRIDGGGSGLGSVGLDMGLRRSGFMARIVDSKRRVVGHVILYRAQRVYWLGGMVNLGLGPYGYPGF